MSAGHHRTTSWLSSRPEPVSGSTVVHRLATEVKIVAAVSFVLIVALTPPRAPLGFAGHALAITAVAAMARLSPTQVLKRLMVVMPFLASAALLPLVAGGEQTRVAWLAVSVEGLWASSSIAAKTLIGAMTSIVLTSTTSTTEIVAGLGRLGLPKTLVAIAAFMLRYLDLMVAELGRRRTAMTARAYRPRWLWQAKPVATSMGTMFVRSYERGERVHSAMLSRGFTGAMPTLTTVSPDGAQWLMGALLPVAALAALSVGWLLR